MLRSADHNKSKKLRKGQERNKKEKKKREKDWQKHKLTCELNGDQEWWGKVRSGEAVKRLSIPP